MRHTIAASGLFASAAVLARNAFGATPHETVITGPSVSAIAAFTCSRIASGSSPGASSAASSSTEWDRAPGSTVSSARARDRVVGCDVELRALVAHREVWDEMARLLGALALAQPAALRGGVDRDEHRGAVVRVDGRYADGAPVERGVGALFARSEEIRRNPGRG